MSLKKPLLAVALVVSLTIAGQVADCYDTMLTRAGSHILVPKYDTIKQLDKANDKADKILEDLSVIMKELNIKDTVK